MAVSLKLDHAEQERLRKLAEVRQRAPHYLMKEAVRQYLDREEARESFKQEALAAWRNYQETDQHITGEEAAAWLKTWGTDDEVEPPACHG